MVTALAQRASAGWKSSEFGPIPSDWKVCEALHYQPFITSGSRGWAKYYCNSGAAFIRITNLSHADVRPDLSDLRYVCVAPEDAEAQRTKLKAGDVLISITADIGAIGYVGPGVPSPAYINQHIACLRLPEDRVHSLFIAYFLASYGPQRRFAETVDVGAKSGLNLTAIGKLKLLVPPLAEQHLIAEALSDADALIKSLEELIAKKSVTKQGAMRELLSGQNRLKGFSGTWKSGILRQVCREIVDGTHFTPIYFESGVPFYSVENVTADDFTNTKFISPEEHKILIRRCKPEKGDILLTRIGAIGDTKLIDWDVDASIYVSLALLKCGDLIEPKFLYAYTKGSQFLRDIEDRSLLNAAPRKINMGEIGKVPIPIPNRDEQIAIAEVLDGMDNEIKTLNAKLSKAQKIKQGMMHELLTGRVRLI